MSASVITHLSRTFFFETLPHGKCCYSALQTPRETNDGDSESREQGLEAQVSLVVAEHGGYVD